MGAEEHGSHPPINFLWRILHPTSFLGRILHPKGGEGSLEASLTTTNLWVGETCGTVERREQSLSHLLGFGDEVTIVPGELRVSFLLEGLSSKVGTKESPGDGEGQVM